MNVLLERHTAGKRIRSLIRFSTRINSNPGAVECLWCLAVREGNHGYNPDTRKWVLGDEVVPKAKGSPGLVAQQLVVNWLPPVLGLQLDIHGNGIVISCFNALFPMFSTKTTALTILGLCRLRRIPGCPPPPPVCLLFPLGNSNPSRLPGK